jgi:hypothetical protein
MTLTKSKSFVVTCLMAAVIAFCFFNNPRQKNGYFRGELEWDVFSYYMYLPFTFIYDDVGMQKQEVVQNIFKTYNLPGTFYQAYRLDNGNYTPNYTMGFALLWSPFFFAGHIIAKTGGFPADGWSLPYQLSVAIGALFYILLGLFFLRKVLLKFFSESVTSWVLFLMVMGTNYFHETFNDYMQPHGMIAAGYAILLYYTIRWHEEPRKKYVRIAGLVMGLMILARPSEILCVFIPILWNVYNRESWRTKLQLMKSHGSHIFQLLLFAFLPFIPQILYWKYVTGSWIFFSYKNTEGFDFLQPHIFNVLFSFKKSWLVYTPIIIFSIIGVFLLKKANRNIFLPILVFFLLNFYLLSSWAAWWNGGSFGMRYFVDSYPVLAIPFGYCLLAISRKRWIARIPLYLAITFFVVLNLFQTWQYVHAVIPEDRMNWAYYKRIFFNRKVNDEDRKLMEVQRSYESTEHFGNKEDYNHRLLAYLDFDSLNTEFYDESKLDTTYHRSGRFSYRMPGDDEWGPRYKIQYDQLVPGDKDHAWLKVKVHYYTEGDIKDNPASLVINMPHFRYNLKYRGVDFEQLPFKPNEWNEIEFEYMTPFPYSETDHFEIYIWHRGKKPLWLDDISVEGYLKK